MTPTALRVRYLEITGDRLVSHALDVTDTKAHATVREFIVHHILMPSDREGRDRAVERLYDMMKGVRLMGLSDNLRESVELIHLAESLDASLVAILQGRHFRSLSLVDAEEIDLATREEGRPNDRRRQIELLCNNLRFFHRVANTPLAKLGLPMMKKFAKAIGVAALTDQIDFGYRAACSIGDVQTMAAAIQRMEAARLDRIFEVRP